MGLTTKEISSSSFNDMISSVDRRSEYVENRAGANVRLNNFLTPYTLDDKSSILNAPCGYSNGVYPSLRPIQTFGPELVTNGDFATDTDWSKQANWTISGGKANTNGSGLLYQTGVSYVDGFKYEVTFTANIISGSGTVRLGNTSSPTTFANGFNKFILQTSSSNTTRYIFFQANSMVGTIDNVSVKKITDADFQFSRGSSATRINELGLIQDVQLLSGELVQNGDFEQIGSELVTNGNFENWTADNPNSWTVINEDANNYVTQDGTYARIVSNDTASIQIKQTIFTIGKTYKVELDAVVNSGNEEGLKLNDATAAATIGYVNSTGHHTFYFKAAGTSFVINRKGGGDTDISIDNVSVKEVGQNWDFSGDTTVVDNGVKFDNTSVYSDIRQNNIMTPNSKIRLTITIEDYVGGGIAFPQFGVADGNGDPNFNISSNGTYVFESVFYSTNLTVKRTGNGTDLVVSNISVIEITDDTDLPRIDYTNGTGSLLLEPQRTNYLYPSNGFVSWSAPLPSPTRTANYGISPDGTQNSTRADFSNEGIIYRSPNRPQGDYVFSVFAKNIEGGGSVINLRVDVPAAMVATFDLSNGTIVSNSSDDAKIEDYGNGWYRCILIQNNDEIKNAVIGEGTTELDCELFGAMLEQGSYPTSYIPTNGSTVTRNADLCNNAGNSDLINSTEGVLYCEIAALADDGTSRRISLSNGSISNRVSLEIDETANRIRVHINASLITYDASDLTLFNKIAVKYKVNDYALWLNGVEVATSFSFEQPSGMNVLSFTNPTGAQVFYGNVKCVAVFKEALTDEELAKITSTTQQEVFYEMRDKMLQINADYYEFGDYTTRLKKLF